MMLPLDVRPVAVNVTGVGVVSVPFGAEPALSVAQFLLEARSKGHAIDADGATQIMEAVCANRPATLRCLVPLTVAPFSLNIPDIGTFVVPFGAEPAAQLADFVNAVAAADPYGPAGRGEVVDASVAEQIMNLTCQSVACFVPIDLSPLSLNVTGYGRLVVPFGTEPAVGVDNFLRRCVAAGCLERRARGREQQYAEICHVDCHCVRCQRLKRALRVVLQACARSAAIN